MATGDTQRRWHFDFSDICTILESDAQMQTFYDMADDITMETKGNVVNVRAIVEFSNYCRRNCEYCGINCKNTLVQRYRMTPDEIVDCSLEAAEAGYKTVVLQSGEDEFFTPELLSQIIREIKSKRDIAVTLSSGEMSEEAYALIKDAGCDRYLLKHETSDFDLYSKLHPGYSYSDRKECLKTLKKLGFETGGGFMIGLPGQTTEIIARDIQLIESIPCDMAGIGPFIPHPHTLLAKSPKGSVELTRRAIAITRILLPQINLPATTSLAVLNKEERNKVFSGGANVIMKKVTPPQYRDKYEIYPMKHGKIKSVKEEREEINNLLKSIGKDYD